MSSQGAPAASAAPSGPPGPSAMGSLSSLQTPSEVTSSLERCLRLIISVRAGSGAMWRAVRQGASIEPKETFDTEAQVEAKEDKQFRDHLKGLLDNVSKDIS